MGGARCTPPCDTGAVPAGDADDRAALADGVYDALVVDASANDDGSISVEVTIIAGPAKGDVVSLRTSGLAGDNGFEPLDLLGVPATLTVAGGAPSLRLEP